MRLELESSPQELDDTLEAVIAGAGEARSAKSGSVRQGT